MSGGVADLKALQGKIKRDPDGYHEEFLLQYRHYRALLDIFLLKPSKDSEEFAHLVDFVSHVGGCYPTETEGFTEEIMDLLDKNYAVLTSSLRRCLAQALILIRNRGRLSATVLLPLFFRLFKCTDKKLRGLLFSHIVSDIVASNKKHRDEKLNRHLQGFLFQQLQEEDEQAAKKSLNVLTELYRRQVWTDQRAVNVLSSACFSPKNSVMVGALKFFLGQDEKGKEEDEDSDEEKQDVKAAADAAGSQAVSKEDIYKAYSKGVAGTKKKKQAKLKRVIAKAKRQARQETTGEGSSTFAALQLLHDPQGFAEKLFAKIQGNTTLRFEVKVLILGVVSRVIGMHQLQLLHFYPYMQRYLMPHQREATRLLALAVQACHSLVPPDAVEPMLRQVVHQFVHDKARPEVMAVGLQTVREMCMRTPLVMTPELLQDLTEYKKDRDRGVRMAARSLITLFRSLAPSMLVKKDRGKGADTTLEIQAFGQSTAATRVEGAELLSLPKGASDGEGSEDEDGSDLESGDEEDDEEDEEEEGGGEEDGEDAEMSEEEEEDGREEGASVSGEDEEESEDEQQDDEEDEEEEGGGSKKKRKRESERNSQAAQEGSLRSLKKLQKAKQDQQAAGGEAGEGSEEPVEQSRFLTDDDFRRIRALQAERSLSGAMSRAGAKKGQQLAHDFLATQQKMLLTGDSKLNPGDLEGQHNRKRQNKEARLAHVTAGRDERAYGAASGRHKKKTGGLSNSEKAKRKALPLAARIRKATRNQRAKGRGGGGKNFKGRKAWQK